MKRLLLIVPLLAGCQIQKFVPPPYAAAVVSHSRFFGVNAKIPLSSGGSVVEVQLGWGSAVWSVIPVCTNEVFAAPISDTFKIGQQLNPFDTTITEDLQTGWKGSPPVPRLIAPK